MNENTDNQNDKNIEEIKNDINVNEAETKVEKSEQIQEKSNTETNNNKSNNDKITKVLGIVMIVLGVILIVVIALYWILISMQNEDGIVTETGKIDDWVYEATYVSEDSNSGAIVDSLFSTSDTAISSSTISTDSVIGYSTGGAKDVENFRENIQDGYFPISTDITYNGLFYDYTFDTGNVEQQTEDDLFYPSYSTAISEDPVSGEDEYYMTVGLNSNIKESDFSRKKLNLVILLDISGSMSSSFDSYYYDEEESSEDDNKSKMTIAEESVNILLDQLNDDDRFGMVLFNSNAYLAKPMNLIGDTDIDAIKEHILEVEATGGTDFEAGYLKATELLEEYINVDTEEYENRIIVITDAMPNTGTTSSEGLLSYVEENANDRIYTTFIGVGVDFNTELTESISDVRGANYYSVHNSSEFKERMGEQFEYMVTPLVFDLQLNLYSDTYEIAGIYGSDTQNDQDGNIMYVNTLFPSVTTDDGEVKGGVILIKLNKKDDSENVNEEIVLDVSYSDRQGNTYNNSQTVNFTSEEDYYDNTGIRKAIVLTRYVNTLKEWILYERSDNDSRFLITDDTGIVDCLYTEEEIYNILGQNERTSVELSVSEEYKEIFDELKSYMESEITAIQDDTLNQEIEILNILIEA